MKNKTLKCKCGSTLFVRNLRVSGWQMQIIDSVTSEITYTNSDQIRYVEPKTITCGECGRAHKNLFHGL